MYRQGSHTQYDIQYHLVWTTKYRYKVLNGKVAERARELIRQGCEAKGITIIQGSDVTDRETILENYEYYNSAIESVIIEDTKLLPHLEKSQLTNNTIKCYI